MQLWGFSAIDIFAVSFFMLAWCGHFWIVNRSRFHNRTISYHMNKKRVEWMKVQLYRNPKMYDALVQNGLQQGVLFFASTSILIVGALLAGLGATDAAVDTLTDLPFSSPTTRTVWEIKLLLITCIFVFTFFKFAWSYRQFNYVMIVAGAAPEPNNSTEEDMDAYARKMAAMHALAALHFTTGLNAYFFALAAFVWFLNVWAFIFATVWVTAVLLRRAFASKFVKILTDQPL